MELGLGEGIERFFYQAAVIPSLYTGTRPRPGLGRGARRPRFDPDLGRRACSSACSCTAAGPTSSGTCSTSGSSATTSRTGSGTSLPGLLPALRLDGVLRAHLVRPGLERALDRRLGRHRGRARRLHHALPARARGDPVARSASSAQLVQIPAAVLPRVLVPAAVPVGRRSTSRRRRRRPAASPGGRTSVASWRASPWCGSSEARAAPARARPVVGRWARVARRG